MKVLAIVHKYPPVHNAGAEWMLHSILRRWAELGDACTVTFKDLPAGDYDLDGVQVERWPDDLAAFVEEHDVVVTHLDETRAATDAARKAKRPIVHLIHNDAQLRHHGVRAGRGVLAVFNSEWLRETVRWSGAAVVCRPHVRVADYSIEHRPEQVEVRGLYGDVTLINLSAAKGVRTFVDVARHEPRRSFLAVRGAYGAQEDRLVRGVKNVTVIGETSSIRDDVYARTRVLLVPSRYESWGRVAVEACCSGIPVIASPTPGLIEALADAACFARPTSTKDWLTILRCLDDPDEYAHHSRLARERALLLERETGADVDRLRDSTAELIERYRRPERPGSFASPSVSVLVPLRVDGDVHRMAAWDHVRHHYAREHPEWEIVPGYVPLAEDGSQGPWSKGAALRDARGKARGTVFVIADADSIVDPTALEDAVDLVASGEAGWVQPYTWVRRFDERTTRHLYEQRALPKHPRYERGAYKSVRGGGVVVTTAKAYDVVGGVDPRFIGWGGEDIAFGFMLDALASPSRTLDGDLAHLWHPHAAGKTRNRPPTPASAALLDRYRQARQNPDTLRALLAERE